jgi:hypothetical protein
LNESHNLAEILLFDTLSSDALLLTAVFVCSFGFVKYFSRVFSRRLAAIASVAVAAGMSGILMRFNA